MFEHLQYRRALVNLNDDDSVKYREFVLDLVDTLEKDERELVELARGIEQQMEHFLERKQELEAEKNSIDEDLAKTRDHLARLGAAHLKDLNRWAVNFEPPFNRIEARNCNGGRRFLSRANPKLDGRIIFQPSPGDR